MAPPNIRIRGLNRGQGIPKGYVLGRTSSGRGPVELLKQSDLRTIGAGGSGGSSKRNTGFGFFIQGRMLASEIIGSAVFAKPVTFTDGSTASIATAQVGPTVSRSFTFVVNMPGPTVVGTITFAANSKVGVIDWTTSPFILPAGTALTVYAPSVADLAFADVSATVSGKS